MSDELRKDFQYDALPCNYVVYRAARNASQVNQDVAGQVTTMVYARHMGRDDDGISVYLGSVDTPEKAAAKLNKCYGVASLHVGHVRDIEIADLDVIQDEPDHGLITGIPFIEED